MKKYLWMSSAAVVIGALRVNIFQILVIFQGTPREQMKQTKVERKTNLRIKIQSVRTQSR